MKKSDENKAVEALACVVRALARFHDEEPAALLARAAGALIAQDADKLLTDASRENTPPAAVDQAWNFADRKWQAFTSEVDEQYSASAEYWGRVYRTAKKEQINNPKGSNR